MDHRFAFGENYAVYFKTNFVCVGLNVYILDVEIKKSIEINLRKQLPNFDFFDDFYHSICINSCICESDSEKIFENNLKNIKFNMELELEYTCYRSDWGIPKMSQLIDIEVQFL